MVADGYCHTRDICDVNFYATPVVPIGLLPGAAAGLEASLMGHSPDGFTPTGPALKGAIQQAKQYAAAHPDYKVAVILVTDGLPGGFTDAYTLGNLVTGFQRTECNPTDIPSIAATAAAAATGTTPVPTFVIGVFTDKDSNDGNAQPKLDMLASQGGTGAAVVINATQDVSQLLQNALAKIRTTEIACEYKIPPPSAGTIAFDKVNVAFTAGSGTTTTLGYGSAEADCGPKVGWHYDVPDPNKATPSSIVICADTCKQFQSDSSGRLDIQLGCQTVIIP